MKQSLNNENEKLEENKRLNGFVIKIGKKDIKIRFK